MCDFHVRFWSVLRFGIISRTECGSSTWADHHWLSRRGVTSVPKKTFPRDTLPNVLDSLH